MKAFPKRYKKSDGLQVQLCWVGVRNAIGEKNGIMWEKFPSGGPPPQFGKPLLSKKKLGLFFILGPQEHFWSSPKIHHFG